MAFIRPSRNAFTSEQSDAVESVAKAFFSNEKTTHSKPAEVFDAYRTRPFAYGPNCNRGDTCTYANDSEKLVPGPCKFDARCFNRKSCLRFHTPPTMDECITVNNFTWPAKKVKEVTYEETSSSSTSEKSDDSFVIQIEESNESEYSEDSEYSEYNLECEIDEVCDEIDITTHQEEFLNEIDLAGADYEFDNFVDYTETLHAFQTTLKKLHDEYQYAQFIQSWLHASEY